MKKLFVILVSIGIAFNSLAQISGNSIQLQADGNYVTVPDAASASLSNNMTWEFWIYYKCENGNTALYPLTKGWCGSTWSYYVELQSGQLNFQKFNPGGSGACPSAPMARYESAAGVIPYNTWSHVAIVMNGTDVQFYINGQAITTTLTAGNSFVGAHTSPRPFVIGAYQNAGGSFVGVISGNLDDVRLWHSARTQQELIANMNSELLGNEPNLYAYWKLNEAGSGAGITVANSAIATGAITDGTTVGTALNLQFVNNNTVQNQLPTCDPIAWFKADAGVYTDAGITLATNGQPVQQWNDQSGNGYHMSQMNAAEKPILASSSVNGKPALLFDGNDMLTTLSQIDWNSTTNNDIFIVCKSTAPDNMLLESSPSTVSYNGSFYLIDNYTGGGYGISGALKGTNGGFRIFKNTGGFIACTKIYQVTQDMNLAGTNAIKIKYNNVMLSDNTGYNSGTPSGGLSNHFLYAGRRSDNTYGLIGNIAEIAVYQSKLSEAKAQEVYTYLYQKYFTGTGIAQFNSLSSSTTNSNDILNDEIWKHTLNTANTNQVIASIRDYCLDLGTRNDTVFVEPTAQTFGSAYYMRRHYVVNTSLNPVGTKRVRLYYTDADFADLQSLIPSLTAHNQLVVTKYDGPNEDGVFNPAGGTITFIPSAQISTGIAFGQRYLEFDVDGFSEFWIHTGNAPLPLDVISFTATKVNNRSVLNWQTANMKNVLGFEIEKSSDSKSFVKIGFEVSSNKDTYTFTDPTLLERSNYYRLKIIDQDGKYSYSKTLFMMNTDKNEIQLFPNPVKSELNIIASANNFTYQIFDVYGKEITSGYSIDNNKIVSCVFMSKGVYFIKLKSTDETQTFKFIKE